MKYEITEITKTFTTTVIDVDEHDRSIQECDDEALKRYHDGSAEEYYESKHMQTILMRVTIRDHETGDVVYDMTNSKKTSDRKGAK